MNTRVSVIVLILCCTCCCLSAQEVRIHLDNCKLEAKTLEQIQSTLNFQLVFFAELFKQPVDSSLNARVFENKKEFTKYLKTHANVKPGKNDSKGYYNFQLKEMILLKDAEDFPKLFAHELSHAILHSYGGTDETWIDEGLAELLEDINTPDSASAAIRIQKIRFAQDFFSKGSSLRAVIESDDFYRTSDNFRNYCMSFAAVFYLLNARSDLFVRIARSNFGYVDYPLLANYPLGIDLFEIDVKTFFLNYKLTDVN